MKVICYPDPNIKPEKNARHIINFFGVLGCIKINALGKDESKEQEGNVVKHYFDYPYFSRIVNPKLFKKELDDEEKKFTRRIVSLWLCFAILSTASIVSLYLAYQNQKSKKVLTGLACASAVLLILATIYFIVVLSWLFFDFIKGKFVVHRVKSLLENEVSPEWIKRYKKEFIGETCDQELEKDIEDIIEFLLERKKIVALYNFLTNGEELVQAGMAMVNKLLIDGIYPNKIVLDTNSLGGGVAAEVLKRFEDQGIHLTLIHSNSFSSLKDATNNFPHGVGGFFTRWLPAKFLNFWFRRCGLDFNPQKVVENTKCPVLIAGRKGDTVIPQAAQLVGKLNDLSEERLRRNIVLEHNPSVRCENKNIHTDYKEHLVCCEDNEGTTEYTSYEEIEDKFTKDAHGYLVKLNEGFNLEKYLKSDVSKSLTQIELKFINEECMQV
ncbi:MAG: alpha/beta hydrolase family protein [Wolbachia sp.]